MKRELFVFFFLLFFVSCHKGGGEGEKCLDGNTCAADNLVCTQEGICKPCGNSSDDPCCQNRTCFGRLVCATDGTCQLCGNHDAPCCSGGKCINDSDICSQDNICVTCGFESELCCKNSMCEPYLLCNAQSICKSCGGENEICCIGGNTQKECISGICTPDNICKSTVCSSAGVCTHCGYPNEPCCEGKDGGSCTGGDVCGEDNICFSCGYIGQPACEESGCDGWFAAINGVCSNPFKEDAGADYKSICERAEPGRYTSDRDQCYWYAAYYRKNEYICDGIEWSEMRTLCQEMKYPGFYVVMPF